MPPNFSSPESSIDKGDCSDMELLNVLVEPTSGINAGAAWKAPRSDGIEISTCHAAHQQSAQIQIRSTRLWPTIIWRPIPGSAPGWTLDETPDLDGLMVPLGGHRDIASRWTTFQVFPDNPSTAQVHSTGRPGGPFGPREPALGYASSAKLPARQLISAR